MATKNTAPTAAQPELFDDVHTKFEAYTGKEPYLFVSYSHRDSKVVYSILDELYDTNIAFGTTNPARTAMISGMSCARRSRPPRR